MLKSGLADVYRNEQFLPKNDFMYNIELLLINCNLNSYDKQNVIKKLSLVYIYILANLKETCLQFLNIYKK